MENRIRRAIGPVCSPIPLHIWCVIVKIFGVMVYFFGLPVLALGICLFFVIKINKCFSYVSIFLSLGDNAKNKLYTEVFSYYLSSRESHKKIVQSNPMNGWRGLAVHYSNQL